MMQGLFENSHHHDNYMNHRNYEERGTEREETIRGGNKDILPVTVAKIRYTCNVPGAQTHGEDLA
jgi:hypothetical protein